VHYFALFLTFLVAWSAAAQSQSTQSRNPYENDSKAVDSGKGMFRIYCAPCHGIKAQGGRGPDLTLASFATGERDAKVFEVIAEGRPGTEMQGYRKTFGEDGIWRLISFIRASAKPGNTVVTGDRARGEAIFRTKGACGQCHRVGSEGGRFGPDLSRVGRSRSLDYLRASVVDPSRDIPAGYGTVIVIKKDGSRVEGVQLSLDNFSVQLMDNAERYHSYLREEVKSVTAEPARSLMPSYARSLSSDEVNDLLAYLVSLGAEK
jgi:putative heme-binding domain-containing protein